MAVTNLPIAWPPAPVRLCNASKTDNALTKLTEVMLDLKNKEFISHIKYDLAKQVHVFKVKGLNKLQKIATSPSALRKEVQSIEDFITLTCLTNNLAIPQFERYSNASKFATEKFTKKTHLAIQLKH